MQGHCFAVQQQCLQPGACAGGQYFFFWFSIKIYTHTQNITYGGNGQKKAHKDTHKHTHTQPHLYTHAQPSGRDQYMTRVNLPWTSGSPIKGLGVLIGDHKSQRETNNDVNPQQQHNGPTGLGLWEWKERKFNCMNCISCQLLYYILICMELEAQAVV